MTAIRRLNFVYVQDIEGPVQFAEHPPLRLCIAENFRGRFANIDLLRSSLRHQTYDSLLIVPTSALPQDIDRLFLLATESMTDDIGSDAQDFQLDLNAYSPLIGFATHLAVRTNLGTNECHGFCLNPFDSAIDHITNPIKAPPFYLHGFEILSPVLIAPLNHQGEPTRTLGIALSIVEQLGYLKIMWQTLHNEISYPELPLTIKTLFAKAYTYNFLLYLLINHQKSGLSTQKTTEVRSLALNMFFSLMRTFRQLTEEEKTLFILPILGSKGRNYFGDPIIPQLTGLAAMLRKKHEYQH